MPLSKNIVHRSFNFSSITEEYLKFAITCPTELVVGRTYYMNGQEFIFSKLVDVPDIGTKMVFENPTNDYDKTRFCGDTNMGNKRYNCWLLFENKEISSEYYSKQFGE